MAMFDLGDGDAAPLKTTNPPSVGGFRIYRVLLL
jgi:hypothetical protein